MSIEQAGQPAGIAAMNVDVDQKVGQNQGQTTAVKIGERDTYIEHLIIYNTSPHPEDIELPDRLKTRIIDFLTALPNLDDPQKRRAFLSALGLNAALEAQIQFDLPLVEFVSHLIAILTGERLPDGRYALLAVLEDAKSFIEEECQPNCETLMREVQEYLDHAPGRTRNAIKEERFLDAAMSQQVMVNQTTELVTMIRLPDSLGLRKILQDIEELQAQPEDVKTKSFGLEFPCDEQGNATFLDVWIGLQTDDFNVREARKKIRVYPGKDSDYCTFLLMPKKNRNPDRACANLFSRHLISRRDFQTEWVFKD